jgi:CDP-6-deoxy-D-xylo-4-hexulose-3-dehydrase
MTEWDYPTAFSCWNNLENEAIARVVASGQFTMSREVEAFEHEFAKFHGMRYGIMTNSGSSANLIAVAALFAKRDKPLQGSTRQHPIPDKAIVPAVAWSTTYAPLVQHGLDLVLADVDETWNAPVLDWLPMNVKLVVGCSILGNPGYLHEWKQVADRMGAYFIEDNCESFGAITPGGKRCGTYGIMNTFSFFYSHQISAIEGGMILTNDEELKNLCRILRAHGWTRDVWYDPFGNPARPPRFELEYDFTHFGYNVRPLEMHAAVARVQLRKQVEFTHERRNNAQLFRNMTGELPITHQQWRGVANPFGMPFLCRDAEERRRVVERLRVNGVDARLPTGGSFLRHRYGERWRDQSTPRADDIHSRGIFLGNAPFEIDRKLSLARAAMKETLQMERVA